MPIPTTRHELIDLVISSFDKLQTDLDNGGEALAEVPCVDDWTVRELLAVRAWWTEHVIDWIECGRRGDTPITPAEGYRWKETPRLNADIVEAARSESYRSIRWRLEQGYDRVISMINALNDTELLEVGVYEWAGKWPIARWISINTARQYTTARTYIRRAIRNSN